MRTARVTPTMLALAVTIVAPAAARTPEADCQAGRERLAGHARAAAQAPLPWPTPAAGAPDVDRVACRDVAATLDAAVKARRRELGAREAQAGAIPLAPLRGQTTTAVARELAAQFDAWPEAASQVGLLDQAGKGRVDAAADSPATDAFRVIRLPADGSLGG